MSFSHPQHSPISRRTMLQAGSVGLLGLGMNHVTALRAADVISQVPRGGTAKSVIFVFLSGGLTQHDSFDPKPDAPADIRGEFSPIATQTPGVFVCEHLPMLAARSQNWSLIRSLTTPYNEHSQGHTSILTGRTPMPLGYNPVKPQSSDWPSIASIVGDAVPKPQQQPAASSRASGAVNPQYGTNPARSVWRPDGKPTRPVVYRSFAVQLKIVRGLS